MFLFVALKTMGNLDVQQCPAAPIGMHLKWKLDDTIEQFIIRTFKLVLPSGDYKAELRLFNETDNHTYQFFVTKFSIKATRAIDLYKFTMG